VNTLVIHGKIADYSRDRLTHLPFAAWHTPSCCNAKNRGRIEQAALLKHRFRQDIQGVSFPGLQKAIHMSTTQSAVIPNRYLGVAEVLSGLVDRVAGAINVLRAAFVLAERAEAGHRITLDDLKHAGMF
jgi:hypothetical protein